MSQTDAQKRAVKKSNSDKVDSLHLRLKKGMREAVQNHAKKRDESVNAFITRAIIETMCCLHSRQHIFCSDFY